MGSSTPLSTISSMKRFILRLPYIVFAISSSSFGLNILPIFARFTFERISVIPPNGALPFKRMTFAASSVVSCISTISSKSVLGTKCFTLSRPSEEAVCSSNCSFTLLYSNTRNVLSNMLQVPLVLLITFNIV